MERWWRRLRGAIGMGATWAAAWAPVGAVVALIMEMAAGLPTGTLAGIWVATFVVLGFVGGSVFSAVLATLGGRSRFDQLTLPLFGLYGALGGFVLGALALVAGLTGAGLAPGLREAVIVTTATLLSAGSAAGTLLVARSSERQELLEASDEVEAVGLDAEEARKLVSG